MPNDSGAPTLYATISKTEPHAGQLRARHACYIVIPEKTATLWAAVIGVPSVYRMGVCVEYATDLGTPGVMIRRIAGHDFTPSNLQSRVVQITTTSTPNEFRIAVSDDQMRMVREFPTFGAGQVVARITSTGALWVPFVSEDKRVPPRHYTRKPKKPSADELANAPPLGTPASRPARQLTERDLEMQIRAAKAAGAPFIILPGGTRVPLK